MVRPVITTGRKGETPTTPQLDIALSMIITILSNAKFLLKVFIPAILIKANL